MSSHHNSSPPPQGGGGGPAPGPGPVPLVPHHPHPVHHVHRHSHSHHRSSSMIRADLLDLARHLRQERLYIAHERSQLQELNDKVALSSEKLSHTAWVAHQQRENMDELIFASRGVELISPGTCVQRSNLLEQTLFQDSYKCLSYQEVSQRNPLLVFFVPSCPFFSTV